MGQEAISNLLGFHESDSTTKVIQHSLSNVLGKDVKIASPVKNGYRTDEHGKLWLKDIDPDEIK